jgi:hypothetical protein
MANQTGLSKTKIATQITRNISHAANRIKTSVDKTKKVVNAVKNTPATVKKSVVAAKDTAIKTYTVCRGIVKGDLKIKITKAQLHKVSSAVRTGAVTAEIFTLKKARKLNETTKINTKNLKSASFYAAQKTAEAMQQQSDDLGIYAIGSSINTVQTANTRPKI